MATYDLKSVVLYYNTCIIIFVVIFSKLRNSCKLNTGMILLNKLSNEIVFDVTVYTTPFHGLGLYTTNYGNIFT